MNDPMKSPDRDAADELVKPCTCHPDDNPPVPCAQKYALTDCKASELAALRRRVSTGNEHIIRYGQHLPNCPRGKAFAAGEIIPRECDCGFSDAISEAMFSPLPPG